MCPPVSEAKTPSRENELRINNLPVSIPGVSDRGLNAQVAGIPLTNNLQSFTPGIKKTEHLLIYDILLKIKDVVEA